jgi:hypothetical protein
MRPTGWCCVSQDSLNGGRELTPGCSVGVMGVLILIVRTHCLFMVVVRKQALCLLHISLAPCRGCIRHPE